jgi:hypothetical protein
MIYLILFFVWCMIVFWMITHPVTTLIAFTKYAVVGCFVILISPLILSFVVFCFMLLVYGFVLTAHMFGIETYGYNLGFWGMYFEMNGGIFNWLGNWWFPDFTAWVKAKF